jgi:hypothetical protein
LEQQRDAAIRYSGWLGNRMLSSFEQTLCEENKPVQR